MRLPFECTLALLGFTLSANGLKFQAQGRRHSSLLDERSVSPRGNAVGLTNSGDIKYYTTVNVGNKDFDCLIDTGSSDLWVAGTPDNAKDTGKSLNINYAIGAVTGKIKTTSVKFAGNTISDQAYLEVPIDKSNPSGTGLIGLGPNTGSSIWGKLKPDTAGYTVLDNIFSQNKSTPNFMTVMLGRSQDPSNPSPGEFSVGEVSANFTDVTNQPKNEVTDVPVSDQGDQHFQILLDHGGILGPDGQSIYVKTKVDGTKDDYQPTAILDTGFSLSQVPKNVASAIYSRFEGAEYVNITGVGETWIVPCGMEVNLTFTIGGVQYPIHPLDTTLDPTLLGTQSVVNSNGTECCIGMFQPITFNKDTFDIILGMSFLRNTYALINYGDFAVNNNTKNKEDPYIQLLSTTTPAEGHAEFVQVRLNGDDTTGNIQLLPASADSTSEPKSVSSGKPSWFWYVVIGGAIAGGLSLIAFVWALFRRRANRGRGKYAKLEDPYSGGGVVPPRSQNFDMHAIPNLSYNGDGDRPYDPQAQGKRSIDTAPPYDPHSYKNPWDHRD